MPEAPIGGVAACQSLPQEPILSRDPPNCWDSGSHGRVGFCWESWSGFHSPSPIQRAAVPLALEGHDLVGVAATGSGKWLGRQEERGGYGIQAFEMGKHVEIRVSQCS